MLIIGLNNQKFAAGLVTPQDYAEINEFFSKNNLTFGYFNTLK